MRQIGINPWLEVCTKPRATIRTIVDVNPRTTFWFLSGIYGFPLLLEIAQNASLGERVSLKSIVILSVLLAAPVGAAFISGMAALFYWTGRWIGGKAPFSHVRAAICWSSVPEVLNGFFWTAMILLFGAKIFRHEFIQTPFVGGQLALLFLGSFTKLAVGFWRAVLLFKMVSEVQLFSIWKALLTGLMSTALITFILILVMMCRAV